MNLPMNHPLSGAGVAGEAEAADGSPDSGSGKPDRRMTKKEEAAAKRAAKTAQEREWDDLAQADATLWWEYAEKRFGPDAGGRGGFLALRGMIRRALGAGYSAAQIREALRFANVRVPSKQSWDAALAKASGHQVPGGNPRQQRQPAYVATPKQHDDQAPAVRTQEQLDELFGATG
jgi:hypothetical protein